VKLETAIKHFLNSVVEKKEEQVRNETLLGRKVIYERTNERERIK
jgi:DNA polymerase I-like protein with 3'-5' exonuclease and polymerase domains